VFVQTKRLLSTSRSELHDVDDDEDNNNEQLQHGGSDDDNDDLLFNQHSVFCQMDMLCDFEDGDVAWKEIAR